jgi:hypothetical protein
VSTEKTKRPASHEVWRTWFPVVLFTSLVIWVTSNGYKFSYDDAYITFRVAENFATGQGLAYNVGRPDLGTTAPGYALLLVFVHRPFDFVALPELSGLISGVSLLTICLSLYFIGQQSHHRIAGLAPALFTAVNPVGYSPSEGRCSP